MESVSHKQATEQEQMTLLNEEEKYPPIGSGAQSPYREEVKPIPDETLPFAEQNQRIAQMCQSAFSIVDIATTPEIITKADLPQFGAE